MGAMDKFLNSLNLGGNVDSADEYYDDYDDDSFDSKKSKKDNNDKASKVSKVTSIGSNKKKMVNSNYEINVIKPTTMEDSKEITNSLLQGKAVLLNLTYASPDLARDVLNFAFGSAYALNGQAKPIINTIYVIVPEGVDISGIIAEDENSSES